MSASDSANSLFVDIKENRTELGLDEDFPRFGIGATVQLLDCDGNILVGAREVNGGYGLGTMTPGRVHLGLPDGPNTPIVIQISFPRTATGRVTITRYITPNDFNNGQINLVDFVPDNVNNPPIAQDDNITVTGNNAVVINALVDNGNGPDSDPEGDSIGVVSITQPANGLATLNGDGTITYNPNGFIGDTSFSYTLEDNVGCGFAATTTVGQITITIKSGILITNRGITYRVNSN